VEDVKARERETETEEIRSAPSVAVLGRFSFLSRTPSAVDAKETELGTRTVEIRFVRSAMVQVLFSGEASGNSNNKRLARIL